MDGDDGAVPARLRIALSRPCPNAVPLALHDQVSAFPPDSTVTDRERTMTQCATRVRVTGAMRGRAAR